MTNKKFNACLKQLEDSWQPRIKIYGVEDFGIYNTKIKKVYGTINDYDIIVSVEHLDVSLALIKDAIEEVCDMLEISINKILIEL